MRKRIFVFWLLMLIFTAVQGKQPEWQIAAEVARNFYYERAISLFDITMEYGEIEATLYETRTNGKLDLYYVFNMTPKDLLLYLHVMRFHLYFAIRSKAVIRFMTNLLHFLNG